MKIFFGFTIASYQKSILFFKQTDVLGPFSGLDNCAPKNLICLFIFQQE